MRQRMALRCAEHRRRFGFSSWNGWGARHRLFGGKDFIARDRAAKRAHSVHPIARHHPWVTSPLRLRITKEGSTPLDRLNRLGVSFLDHTPVLCTTPYLLLSVAIVRTGKLLVLTLAYQSLSVRRGHAHVPSSARLSFGTTFFEAKAAGVDFVRQKVLRRRLWTCGFDLVEDRAEERKVPCFSASQQK